jgi:hypothetical protein
MLSHRPGMTVGAVDLVPGFRFATTELQMVCDARRIAIMYIPLGVTLLAAAAILFGSSVRAQQATATLVAAETPQSMLAAQIRTQGFTCDKPLGAVRDKKRSRPDRAVWVLRCGNATYRIARAPDMAAKVEPLPSPGKP